MNEVKSSNMEISLYLYRLYKSKYLEENKDKELKQDEINENMDSKKLLYMFNSELPEGEYLDKIKKCGTEITVDGYNYNMNTMADIISKLVGKKIYSSNIFITSNENKGNNKIVSIFCSTTLKTYKITVNENNKALVIPRKFKTYGVNMLCIDEVEDINIDNEYLSNIIIEALNKNGGYITDIRKLFLFKDIIPMKFIRKWDSDDYLVSIMINEYCSYDYFEEDCFDEYGDDD